MKTTSISGSKLKKEKKKPGLAAAAATAAVAAAAAAAAVVLHSPAFPLKAVIWLRIEGLLCASELRPFQPMSKMEEFCCDAAKV